MVSYETMWHQRVEIKIFVLIYVKENRLVDAEYSTQIFYFFKVLNFLLKKYLQTCEEI